MTDRKTPAELQKSAEEKMAELRAKATVPPTVGKAFSELGASIWGFTKSLMTMAMYLAIFVVVAWVAWQAVTLTWAGLNLLKGWVL